MFSQRAIIFKRKKKHTHKKKKQTNKQTKSIIGQLTTKVFTKTVCHTCPNMPDETRNGSKLPYPSLIYCQSNTVIKATNKPLPYIVTYQVLTLKAITLIQPTQYEQLLAID